MKLVVFFDFDNTITTFDVLDDMLLKFSKDERWRDLEEKWKDGLIGSKKCLTGQMAGIRITKEDLDSYLKKIKIDPYFKILLKLLQSKGAHTFILSDNFDYIIKRILKNNDIGDGIRLYSNALKLLGERTIPSFPLSNKRCGTCGNCKKDVLLSNNNGHLSVYVGDGLSDVHPSRHADIVFAKDSLLKYYKEKELPCIKYKNLKEVYGFIKRLPDGGKEH